MRFSLAIERPYICTPPFGRMPSNAPIPGHFEQDTRVSFDQVSGKWQYEDDEGTEHEWNGTAWIPIIDDELVKAQQAAYSVPGVDESTPSNAAIAREERRNKKRKKGEKDYTSNTSNAPAAHVTSKPAPAPSVPKKTGVWVTNLPPNTTVQKLADVFSKAGVLHIDDEGNPRIKMYYDDEGNFKGEAWVVYFKEGSVDLAITLLDDTELELGAGYPPMRVKVAEYFKEKHRMSKRMKTLQSKITWRSDDESDDAAAPLGGAPAPTNNRFARVVVLKGMFVLEDLEKDPALLLELKEEVREEAETLGQVTSVILYDKEEDGVMTIKFKEPVSAQACVAKMNNRYFDGRVIYAGLYNGKERFKKSGGRTFDEDGDQEEKERLDNFAHWLVEGEDEEAAKK
ncbi:HIV Tat-specific factor 1 [Cryptococcus gattii E566]|uniref:HIV Tat-specific factor 1 n=1 Tax=Cryptococcus gattii EJB2 TaxID=1296103 RepID=A0ABR5C4T8_9TREE|nr:HIV Tat-specific factor 1 [Cryptococcus gattii EJB2]KIY32244.1 HIV Tat-specific factor 1 [Cryptococcus gattii E566]KJE04752.1 HIV Tat-specific factor 1 [Cryptococcus gattii NT-10]